jgi:hypothetical protein
MEDRRTEKRWPLRNCCRFMAVHRAIAVRQGAACPSSEPQMIRSLLEFYQRSARRPQKWPNASNEQCRPVRSRSADRGVDSARQINPESPLPQINPNRLCCRVDDQHARPGRTQILFGEDLPGEAIVDAGCVCRRPTDEPARDIAADGQSRPREGPDRVPTPTVPGSERVPRPSRRDRALGRTMRSPRRSLTQTGYRSTAASAGSP